jgi:hypothetical protein
LVKRTWTQGDEDEQISCSGQLLCNQERFLLDRKGALVGVVYDEYDLL